MTDQPKPPTKQTMYAEAFSSGPTNKRDGWYLRVYIQGSNHFYEFRLDQKRAYKLKYVADQLQQMIEGLWGEL